MNIGPAASRTFTACTVWRVGASILMKRLRPGTEMFVNRDPQRPEEGYWLSGLRMPANLVTSVPCGGRESDKTQQN